MGRARVLTTTLLAAALLAACGGGGAEAETATFTIRLRGQPASEEFRIATASAPFIAKAREQLALPEAERKLFPIGPIAAGDGGHNPGWNWHFSGATLTQVAIELCDARPSEVEANLAYWLGTVKSFCPWSAYVHAEVR